MIAPLSRTTWLGILIFSGALVGALFWFASGVGPTSSDGDQFPYVAASRSALSVKLNVPREDIDVISIAAKDWPDTSLGCPESGKAYAQVITPGYIVVLEYGEDLYIYHADQANVAVTCP